MNAIDGLQCNTGAFDELFCQSAFRWPGELVYAKVRETEMNHFRPIHFLLPLSPQGINPY